MKEISDKYARVTEVLSLYLDMEHIPIAAWEAGAYRGTEVHKYCAAIAQGLWVPTIPQEYQGYVDSFRLWFDSQVEKVLLVEERLHHPVYPYTGQIDLLVDLKGDIRAVVDLKTPVQKSKLWEAQLGAYVALVNSHHYKKEIHAGSLRLHPEGKAPKMDWYNYTSESFNQFLNALMAYLHFK